MDIHIALIMMFSCCVTSVGLPLTLTEWLTQWHWLWLWLCQVSVTVWVWVWHWPCVCDSHRHCQCHWDSEWVSDSDRKTDTQTVTGVWTGWLSHSQCICWAQSVDLPAQSMDPYSAQKSMDIFCAIYGLCVGCKSFHYSNPSLAQTYYIDRLATSTNLYNRRNRITDCRRRNSVEHSVAACSCRKITIIRHVNDLPPTQNP